MSDDELDPGASTEMFQAFVDRPEPEAPPSGWKWAAFAVGALVIAVLIAWLVLA